MSVKTGSEYLKFLDLKLTLLGLVILYEFQYSKQPFSRWITILLVVRLEAKFDRFTIKLSSEFKDMA